MEYTKYKFQSPCKKGDSYRGQNTDPIDKEAQKELFYHDFCTRLRRDMAQLTPNELAAVIDQASYHLRLKVGGVI